MLHKDIPQTTRPNSNHTAKERVKKEKKILMTLAPCWKPPMPQWSGRDESGSIVVTVTSLMHRKDDNAWLCSCCDKAIAKETAYGTRIYHFFITYLKFNYCMCTEVGWLVVLVYYQPTILLFWPRFNTNNVLKRLSCCWRWHCSYTTSMLSRLHLLVVVNCPLCCTSFIYPMSMKLHNVYFFDYSLLAHCSEVMQKTEQSTRRCEFNGHWSVTKAAW